VPSSSSESAAASEPATGSGRKLVVLAEDSLDVQGIVRHALEADGCEVVVASDGAETMRILAEHEPQLLVLDLMMPRMSGMDVLRALRESGRLERLPVLVLTARSSEDDIVACLELGASDYVTKPFMLRELRARARALLAREQSPEKRAQEARE
jgi:two-component system response regulator MprA